MLSGILTLAWLGSNPPVKVEGKLLPAIAFDPLVNADSRLSSNQFLGKKTLLLLWSPTSQTCQENVKRIQQTLSQHKDWSLVTVAFAEQGNLVVDSMKQEVKTFLEKNDVAWPTYVDDNGKATMEMTLLMPYGSFGFPTIFVIDRESRVVHICEGQTDEAWEELKKKL